MKDKIKYYEQKRAGEPLAMDAGTRRRYEEWDSEARVGCYLVTKERKLPDKTPKQAGVIFGLLIQSVIEQAEENGIDTGAFIENLISSFPSGNCLDKDFLYQLFLVVCPTLDAEGKRISLSKMNSTQASEFFEKCRNLMAAKEGIYVPDPDPNWSKK